MTQARAWHSAGGGLAVTLRQSPTGLRLCGEADVLRVGALREAIATLPADVPEIHFELAGLRFIDVAGACELIEAARHPARPRLILQITLPCPHCEQVAAPQAIKTGNAAAVSGQSQRAAGTVLTRAFTVPRQRHRDRTAAGPQPCCCGRVFRSVHDRLSLVGSRA